MEEPTATSNPVEYKVGDWFSLVNYCQVTSLDDGEGKFKVTTHDGQHWAIAKDIVRRTGHAALQHTSEVKLTHTELARKLEQAGDTVFCVTFRKKPNAQHMAQQLVNQDLSTPAKRRKLCKTILEGELRTLVGILVDPTPHLGRFTVRDLQVPQGQHNQRLVDTRTITALILRGVHYSLK